MSFHGRDKRLGDLGQLHQMHPAGRVADRDARRSELLRTVQRRRSRRYDGPELADVTAKTLREFLHITDALRQRRVLVQHERHRLRRGHWLISLHIDRPHGEVEILPVTAIATGCPMSDQRETHETTPVWIKPM